jgi:hypothetical protein
MTLLTVCRVCRDNVPKDVELLASWKAERTTQKILRVTATNDKSEELKKIWLDRDDRNAVLKERATQLKQEYRAKIAELRAVKYTDGKVGNTARRKALRTAKKEYKERLKGWRDELQVGGGLAWKKFHGKSEEWTKFYSKKKKKKHWRIM